MRLIAFVFLIICGISAYAQDGFIWRPSTISISIERDDQFLKIGQYILLTNKLKHGEMGWSMMKIDLPDTWKVEGLKIEGDSIVFKNQHKEKFKIAPPKLNELDFASLDGGNKPDRQLELLWRNYAKIKG